jgi:hypothetical protein
MSETATQPDKDIMQLQQALDCNREKLQAASQDGDSQSWLSCKFATACGTDQVLSLLQKHVETPRFLQRLVSARGAAVQQEQQQQATALQTNLVEREVAVSCGEVLQPGWWEIEQDSSVCRQGPSSAADTVVQTPAADQLSPTKVQSPVQQPPDIIDSFVWVQKQDVLDAMAAFVAEYLATIPEAQHMQPKELQAAIAGSFKELRKGRVRRLWEWGRFVYRYAAFGYGAFSVYENPWLVRAVLAALFTAARIMSGMIF